MKQLFGLLFITLFSLSAFSSAKTNDSINPPKAFDFWVGKWKASWHTNDSVVVVGSNTVTKILDDIVIQENFFDPSTNFKGTSISVYNLADKSWHQAWADNSGAYINLIGQLQGQKRIFKTAAHMVKGKTIIQRMVFYNITENNFSWDWESSDDAGVTWKLGWRIFYERIN